MQLAFNLQNAGKYRGGLPLTLLLEHLKISIFKRSIRVGLTPTRPTNKMTYDVYKVEMADLAEPLLVKSCSSKEEAEQVKKQLLDKYWYYMVYILEDGKYMPL